MEVFRKTPEFAAHYGKRLAIVVPYRDRTEHLKSFVPHVSAYFQRDKLDRFIPITIHVVEQSGNAPFNRGKLLNCGYVLARDSAAYFCFHDVDYLPIWADYSWSSIPARLIWHGLHLAEDPENFFGGVVLFDGSAFERVNGYPNSYWGWGFEDAELSLRCKIAGFAFERRDGTYQPLAHKHAGLSAPGVLTEEGQRTHALYEQRRPNARQWMAEDGLRGLKFAALRRMPIEIDGITWPNAFHHLVDIGTPAS
jgi:hypothetical protein